MSALPDPPRALARVGAALAIASADKTAGTEALLALGIEPRVPGFESDVPFRSIIATRIEETGEQEREDRWSAVRKTPRSEA